MGLHSKSQEDIVERLSDMEYCLHNEIAGLGCSNSTTVWPVLSKIPVEVGAFQYA